MPGVAELMRVLLLLLRLLRTRQRRSLIWNLYYTEHDCVVRARVGPGKGRGGWCSIAVSKDKGMRYSTLLWQFEYSIEYLSIIPFWPGHKRTGCCRAVGGRPNVGTRRRIGYCIVGPVFTVLTRKHFFLPPRSVE